MKYLRYIFLKVVLCSMVILSLFASLTAQTRATAARQFDFWAGDWVITEHILNSDGSWLEFPAHNSVRFAVDSLALIEHWEGDIQFFWQGMTSPQHIHGLSVRSYNPKSGHWEIHWMDSNNPFFGKGYAGNFSDSAGVFYFQAPKSPRKSKIVFSAITDTSVHWALSTLLPDSTRWITVWTMDMKRVK